MPGPRTRRTTAAALMTGAVLAAAGLTACSDYETPSSVTSKAASAYASATAEAGRQLDEIKGGADAKGSVGLGDPSTGSDGRTTVEVTVENTTGSTKTFAVQVDFRDGDGNLLDAAVVTVSDVAGGATKKGTARSTRELSGDVSTDVARAVRY